jgi:hypothetical protein
MKIQLERKLSYCRDRIICSVCHQPFFVGRIRTLLYGDRGWLLGDICPDCLKLGTYGIQQTMRDRAILLQKQSELGYASTTIDELATELLDHSVENIQYPNFLQWWLKKWEIYLQELQESEADKIESKNLNRGQQFHLPFQDKE